eukprot:TRINITY_DN43170_c0_g1_i1.p1 TRINITY_DN43170_c0_g1~~TRINITY_DN43170_c0_g1_i1.p1  ORF type:complete len:287 (+),score=67.54 TRINITY_DN43170_c0_g1_i1:60-920(+)
MRSGRVLARRASSVVAPPFRVQLHAWNATEQEAAAAAEEVKANVIRDMKEGTGGVLECVGARSTIAVIKGLGMAEGDLSSAKHASMFGAQSSIQVKLESNPDDYHTFKVHYTADGFTFPAASKVIDVLDKSELPQDMLQWAARTPTDYYNDRPLELEFDKNSPEWEKSYVFSGGELVKLISSSPSGEAIVRGMGPSLFNSFKAIAHAQEAFRTTIPFGLVELEGDQGDIATFKQNIQDYFERGMVHFRDPNRLPGVRGDGRILTPPEGYEDTDHHLIAFGLRLGSL